MDLESNYEIARTANFIHSRNFTRVALQFPDELLRDSTRVVSALRDELRTLRGSDVNGNRDDDDVRLFVMADTTYGSCCVDEVGASHVDSDCVVHYGHTCLSPTSNLPAFYVFGKASINVSNCIENLSNCFSTSDKPILVLFGLEYFHAIHRIKEAMVVEVSRLCGSKTKVINYADVLSSVMNPSEDSKTSTEQLEVIDRLTETEDSGHSNEANSTTVNTEYSIGGLTWNISEGHRMEDYLLFWIGSENTAFSNVVLTFNGCDIVRYDTTKNLVVKDLSQQRKILRRRYYLVERAKDANIVGILVGTLGVAGYLRVIHQMKDLIVGAGKKSYSLVMGRPNPAKLANFPECDVFVYVSCAQTALLDSKEFLAPVITPFEAMLAFSRGSQWTGSYFMEFRDLIARPPVAGKDPEEARFSFLQGCYVEDCEFQEKNVEDTEEALALANATEKTLQVCDKYPHALTNGMAKSGAEFFAARSYHGLDVHFNDSQPGSFLVGKAGKASGYENERAKHEDL